ncbi:HpcH/HpaI aldolase/citrate lyase family protein [Agromyces aerolatus]|uniref:HpcH/HpaI aldolase/citrate lyase family protein n=1 Tax=Agromyces sp. LY-1074 TaxID=3074080 RepID=UPI002867609D|nr:MULTISPECIES: CoA ester lyase [unclassified Agromyces]MDR5701043.1 CoA ester lyase [Agromyces sp. LY-1074]MDR5707683.1 CoA ester lyase [Agromyces sp. LY-1358]
MTRPAFRLGPALLFCPADRPDRFEKALARADAVILDLEDAVAEDRKAAARDALFAHPLDPERVIVRVNPAASAHRAADLEALAGTAYRVVMLAKCEGTADLVDLEDYEVIPLCETARGVLAAPDLAALPNVAALMWGAEDLVASLGGASSRHADGRYRDPAVHARASVLLAAAAHGAAAIDAVHLDLDDDAGLRDEAADAAALGFAATACVHPAQVPVVRAAYRPDDARVEWALAVLARAEGAPGVFAFRGAMVDGPVLRQAEAIVRLAGAATSDG